MKEETQKKYWKTFFFLIIPILIYFILPNDFSESAKRIVAIFSFSVIFWAFEIIPLFSTSLWIVLALSFFFFPSDPKETNLFFQNFANPLILLFLGGFVLAAAIRKYAIDEIILAKILNIVGSSTRLILASVLIISAFFSMWISNTASAAMILTLCKPIFRELSKEDPFNKAILLSIAFGCNIGGIGTPIGTPPNAIALGLLQNFGIEIHFFQWMMMTVPFVIVILGLIYLLLLYFYPPKKRTIKIKIKKYPPLTPEGKKVALIALGMIIFWLCKPLHGISESWVALSGMGFLTALNLITLDDLQLINWDILILMWGGLALGVGIEKSQLLTPFIPQLTALPDFFILASFCVFAIILSSFISNTASANILLPFAIAIASFKTIYIAIPIAVSCSLAMALPVSTPPNALVFSSEILEQKDFYKTGILIGILSLLLVLTTYSLVDLFRN